MRIIMITRWRPPDKRSCCSSLNQHSTTLLFILLIMSDVLASAYGGSVANIPCKPHEKDPLKYECENMQTYVIPHMLNPALTTLKITNSGISSLSNIDVYSKLRHLDLSGNALTTLGEPLSKLSFLTTIIVSENRFTALRKSDLAGLRALTRLDMSKNEINKIEEGTFHDCPLTQLDLSENRLKSFPLSIVQDLPKLQWLSLRDNDFLNVPSSLRKLQQLSYLDMSFNRLGKIPSRVLPDLRTLLLKGCDLSNTSFLTNSSIRHLDLSGNHFATVPVPLPIKLESLLLDNNPIPTLPAKCLSHVPNLRNFSLSSCKELQFIHNEAFAENAEMMEIRFESDVSLKSFHSEMFRSLAKLETVSFRESGLKTIKAGFVSWYLLDRLDLRDNPFRCDCSMSWLRDMTLAYLNATTITTTTTIAIKKKPRPLDDETVHITCAEPIQFADRKLYTLPSSVFECNSSLFHPHHHHVVVLLLLLPIVLVAIVICIAFIYRRRLSKWLFCIRNNKTVPTTTSHTKQQFIEKTYMVPSNDYDGRGIHSPHHNGSHRLIPVTEL